MTPRHLLSVGDLGLEGIDEVLRLADTFVEVGRRPIPKVPALRGKTIVSTFFEDSTRTRLSFETAAKRLSADVMTLHPATIGPDALVQDALSLMEDRPSQISVLPVVDPHANVCLGLIRVHDIYHGKLAD